MQLLSCWVNLWLFGATRKRNRHGRWKVNLTLVGAASAPPLPGVTLTGVSMFVGIDSLFVHQSRVESIDVKLLPSIYSEESGSAFDGKLDFCISRGSISLCDWIWMPPLLKEGTISRWIMAKRWSNGHLVSGAIWGWEWLWYIWVNVRIWITLALSQS